MTYVFVWLCNKTDIELLQCKLCSLLLDYYHINDIITMYDIDIFICKLCAVNKQCYYLQWTKWNLSTMVIFFFTMRL